jgi:hypothetical protein
MTPEKLKKNLELLRKAITRKPERYEADTDFAIKFSDSFTKYTRNSTVHLILSFSELLLEFKWPFPAYILEFSSDKWGKYRSYLAFFTIIYLIKTRKFLLSFGLPLKSRSPNLLLNDKKTINDFMILYFWLHENKIFINWQKNHIFQDKNYHIDNIRTCYKKGLWYACIAASFPLLDLLCRKYFKSANLAKQITAILKTFDKAGITSRDMKPGYIAWDIGQEQGMSADEASQTDLRLIGIGLGSFLDFAGIYYSNCTDDKETTTELNRHAVLHCASSVSSDLWTQDNAIKLLIFIDLMLRLEAPLCMLLKED